MSFVYYQKTDDGISDEVVLLKRRISVVFVSIYGEFGVSVDNYGDSMVVAVVFAVEQKSAEADIEDGGSTAELMVVVEEADVVSDYLKNEV